jgi:S1-C subfamily serine protease
MVLTELTDEERKAQGLGDDSCALLVKGLGQYGPHAAAKNAGFKQGDVLVAFGDRTQRMSESDLFCELMNTTRPGQRLDVAVLREGKRLTLKLPMQP